VGTGLIRDKLSSCLSAAISPDYCMETCIFLGGWEVQEEELRLWTQMDLGSDNWSGVHRKVSLL
jgi:hypothetical protein